MTKDERIKELESAAMQLFDMVHESENIQNKIKANDLYDTIIGQSLPIDSVSQRSEQLICTFELGVENCGFEKKDVDTCKNFRKCECCAN